MNIKKRRKQKAARTIKPDESFSAGPLHIARFGKNILWQSNWKEAEFEKMQQHLVARYPMVVSEIDGHISKIGSLVKILPPAQLLQKAWWEKAVCGLLTKAEPADDREDALAMRMIDYIQSIIVATVPADVQKTKLSPDDWQEIRRNVERLFQLLNLEFHLCAGAKKREEDANYDGQLDKFLFAWQLYWCNVRGNRYQNHQVQALAELLHPQTHLIYEVFGFTSEKLLGELKKIWHSLTFGFAEALEEMESFRAASLDAMESDIAEGFTNSNWEPHEILSESLKRHNLGQNVNHVVGKVFGLALFDLEIVTDLPKSFLEEFSWAPGQDVDFLSEEKSKGWPLGIWPTFKRPFIKLDGRYYCFDLHSLFDHFYRQLEKKIFAHPKQLRQKWIGIRKDVSETLPLNYFLKILPSSLVIKGVYYQGLVGPSGKKQWCEADAIIAYDDHLFILEVKAGSFTYTSPADDLSAHIESLKNLVQSPAKQGQRFLDYFRSSDVVSIFDRNHVEKFRLRKNEYRHVVVCAITQDPFTEIAAQIQRLHEIGIDVGTTPVWSLSIDDLHIYAEIFKNPLEFLHYVEQRLSAFNSEVLALDDELDHLGLYLEHNNYSLYASEMVGPSPAKLNFLGYRSKIDEYFASKLNDAETSSPLEQKMPARLREIVNFLSGIDEPGRSGCASFLLDIASDWRQKICDHIETELNNITGNRNVRGYSTYGDVKLTIFLWSNPLRPRNKDLAVDHTKALVALNEESERLLLELTYVAGELISLDWTWIKGQDIPPDEFGTLKVKAEAIRRTRIEKAQIELGKIGRNQLCPCGALKKYKKCCLLKK